METSLTYLEDSYKFEDKAVVTGNSQDEIGSYLLFNQTIFYPQGGGQPSDIGEIHIDELIIPIISVKMIMNEVRHYTAGNAPEITSKEVILKIDQNKRLLNAKQHTAGHLISNLLEQYNSSYQAVKGHHWPDHSYVEFNLKGDIQNHISVEQLNQLIKEAVAQDYHIEQQKIRSEQLKEVCPNINFNIPNGETLRIVRIGNYPFQPCGGTHIKSLKEIVGLGVSKIKIKNNNIKITYHIN